MLGPFFRPGELPAFVVDLAASGIGALWLIASWLGTPRERRWLAGLLLLAIAGYGGVAIGKGIQWIEEPMREGLEPRYHYAPQTMLALATAVAAGVLCRRASRAVVATAVAWAATLMGGLLLHPLERRHHPHERRSTEAALAEIRAAVSRTPVGETVYIRNRFFEGMALMAAFQEKWTFPGLAGVYVIYFPDNQVDGRPVRFVAIEPEQMSATDHGGRIATLLVPKH